MTTQQEIPYAQWRSCLRKTAYATRKEAAEVAQRANRQEGRHSVEVYVCEWCGRYHAGHRKEKVRG